MYLDIIFHRRCHCLKSFWYSSMQYSLISNWDKNKEKFIIGIEYLIVQKVFSKNFLNFWGLQVFDLMGACSMFLVQKFENIKKFFVLLRLGIHVLYSNLISIQYQNQYFRWFPQASVKLFLSMQQKISMYYYDKKIPYRKLYLVVFCSYIIICIHKIIIRCQSNSTKQYYIIDHINY